MKNQHCDLVTLNTKLNQFIDPATLNEPRLETFFECLLRCETDTFMYNLSLARLFELTLFYAGYCADQCELTTAGDILVNPRKVDLYVDGFLQPIRKKRYEGISILVKSHVSLSDDECVFDFIRDKSITHIIEEPLLEDLYSRLKSSGRFSDYYISESRRRMKKIAHTMGYLYACHLKPGESLFQYTQKLEPVDQVDLELNLCRFNLINFYLLKQEMSYYVSRQVHESMMYHILEMDHPFPHLTDNGFRSHV